MYLTNSEISHAAGYFKDGFIFHMTLGGAQIGLLSDQFGDDERFLIVKLPNVDGKQERLLEAMRRKMNEPSSKHYPSEIKDEKNVVLTEEELKKRNILKADWHDRVNEEFLRRSYDDTEAIWKSFFHKSGLNIIDTLTSSDSTIQIIEQV